MTWLYVLSGAITVVLLVYLFVALLWPERFLTTLRRHYHECVPPPAGDLPGRAAVLAKPLGAYMTACLARITTGHRALHWLGPVERLFYRVAGVNPQAEMGWKRYALAVIIVNVLGALAVYALQRAQQWLPLNPQGFGAITPDSSFNTAISFVSNTNWQGYSGESTMSYLTQMLGLAVQNFLSAATGIAVVIALNRGFARHSANTIATSGSTSRVRRSMCCCRCRFWCRCSS